MCAFTYATSVNQYNTMFFQLAFTLQPINRYSRNNIRSAGNIKYAPVPEGIETEESGISSKNST